MTFIDTERETYGVEPMGAVLPSAPATYFRHKAWQAHPDQRCPRARRDAWLTTQIQRVWDENVCVYGPRKVWQQLIREGITVARCTVERLMRHMGLHGAVRGRPFKTTIPDDIAARPTDVGEPRVCGHATQPPLGRGSDVRGDLARLCLRRLRRLRHRCLRARHRGLARVQLAPQ